MRSTRKLISFLMRYGHQRMEEMYRTPLPRLSEHARDLGELLEAEHPAQGGSGGD